MLVPTIDSGEYLPTAFIGTRHTLARTIHHNGDDASTWDGSNDWDERIPEKWSLVVEGGKEVEVTQEVFEQVHTLLSA